ncbi:MAG TPA: hypothetical protein VF712_02720 [Thermoleophilaceae bacterium]|jgi:hypothetical protein
MRGLALSGWALALALAGCSGGESRETAAPASDQGGLSASGGQALVDAHLAFARCMREQGIDFPDPKPGGGFEVGPETASPERLKEAEEACAEERKAIAEAAPPPSEEELAEDRDATLRFARCMRGEGQDVPDPRPGEGGTSVSVPPNAKSDPGFQRAQRRCEGLIRDAAP